MQIISSYQQRPRLNVCAGTHVPLFSSPACPFHGNFDVGSKSAILG